MILSLTRSTRVGYLRDIRRMTVALSRARLGLYILGRREIFRTCYELTGAFDLLFERPDKLTLTTGEMYPTSRSLEDDPDSTEMEGVEHLGQYVYEMTQAKVAALAAGSGIPSGTVGERMEVEMMVEEDGEVETRDAQSDELDE